MKILSCWNMAQDAFNATKAMRKYGLDADLLILENESTVFSIPAWEDNPKPVSYFSEPDLEEIYDGWKQPSWVRTYNRAFEYRAPFGRLLHKLPNQIKERGQNLVRTIYSPIFFYTSWLTNILREYDVIICHAASSLYAQFSGVPHIPYDAGLIRYLPYDGRLPTYSGDWSLQDKIRFQFLKRSYNKAKCILYTNPDTLTIFKKAGLGHKLLFVPFAIDPERYKPLKRRGVYKGFPIFFAPSRQHWGEKGNHKLLLAFKKLQRQYPEARLLLAHWGTDLQRTKQLIAENNIQNIEWTPVMNKTMLIQTFAEVDAVADQFTIGSYGTTAPEALCCAKRVLMYMKQEYHSKCYGEPAPILNCYTVDEIFGHMLWIAKELPPIFPEGREYVQRVHNPQLVVQRHLEAIQKLGVGN